MSMGSNTQGGGTSLGAILKATFNRVTQPFDSAAQTLRESLLGAAPVQDPDGATEQLGYEAYSGTTYQRTGALATAQAAQGVPSAPAANIRQSGAVQPPPTVSYATVDQQAASQPTPGVNWRRMAFWGAVLGGGGFLAWKLLTAGQMVTAAAAQGIVSNPTGAATFVRAFR